jgi:hypothetical protein
MIKSVFVSNWEHANDIAAIVVFIALFTSRLRNRVPSVGC